MHRREALNMTTHRSSSSDSLLPKTSQPMIQKGVPSRSRLHHLDSLRIFLTSLVIIHHTAIPYGGLGSWPVRSPCFPPLSLILAGFNAVDQTFFMALFYWMAGYFSHVELAHQGTSYVARRDFIYVRLKRLVVPSIFFTVVLEPLLKVMASLRHCSISPDACERTSPFITAMKSIFGYWFGGVIKGINGPVWFCMLLAIFDVVAALLVPGNPQHGSGLVSLHKSLTTPKKMAVILAIVILSEFLMRTWYPIGTVFRLLNIQPGFVPQYIFAYLVGHACGAAGNSHLRFASLAPHPHPDRNPYRTLAIALAVTALGMIPVMASAYLIKDEWDSPLNYIVGGFNLPALLDVIRNEAGFVTIGPALVDLFARNFNRPCSIRLPWRRFTIANDKVKVARYAFATFLVHPPVSMAVELVAEWLMGCGGVDPGSQEWSPPASSSLWSTIGPVIATALVGSVNVLMSWVVAFGVLDLVPQLAMWV